MIPIYREKRKGTLAQMRVDELKQCFTCLGLDRTEVKGTGLKGRVVKDDLVKYLKIHVKDKYEMEQKLGQVCVEVFGSNQKYWVDHCNFLHQYPGGHNLIFKSILSDEYYEISRLGWKGAKVSSKLYPKSQPELNKLIKCLTYLETRELYVKVKYLCVAKLLPELVRYATSLYCYYLGDDLDSKIVVI